VGFPFIADALRLSLGEGLRRKKIKKKGEKEFEFLFYLIYNKKYDKNI
jgi:hypothetical protein